MGIDMAKLHEEREVREGRRAGAQVLAVSTVLLLLPSELGFGPGPFGLRLVYTKPCREWKQSCLGFERE